MRIAATALSVTILIGLAIPSLADEATSEVKTIKSKPESAKQAKYVNFSEALGIPIDSFGNLGDRIDKARLSADPVELAAAADVLQAAEEVSNKKAGIDAKSLSEEAVKLATLRANPTELLIVAKLTGGEEAKELEELAASLTKEQETEPTAVSKDLHDYLTVDNHSHSELHVYVDGREVGHVQPHSMQTFHVHDAHHAVARDHFGHQWVAHFEYGHYHGYNWVVEGYHWHH